ncbi:MAG: type II secretion system F family protein [Myxococcota bacterium]
MQIFMSFLSSFSFGLSVTSVFLGVALLTLGIAVLYARVPDEDRTFKDPLGSRLRLAWPVIRVFEYYLCTNLPNEYLEGVDRRLQKTGVSYLLSAEQFVALRLFLALFVPIVVWLCLASLQMSAPVLLVIAPFAGFMLPLLWLRDTRTKRMREVALAMPVFLDFITMAVEAGLNLSGALQQGVDNGPAGALRTEFNIVLRDIRSGLTRADALRRMSERLEMPEVTGFVSAVIQAERLGSSMATVLRLQADQRRNERFQRAEKMAMEAPVKLVFPLIVFIFPVTFVVLGFPIVMRFFTDGVL